MAQLRSDYQKFKQLNTEIIVIGPDHPAAFKAFWRQQQLPFIGLPNPGGEMLRSFGQQVQWLKLGRMPAAMLIDKQGVIKHLHYGGSMADLPKNEALLAVAREINH